VVWDREMRCELDPRRLLGGLSGIDATEPSKDGKQGCSKRPMKAKANRMLTADMEEPERRRRQADRACGRRATIRQAPDSQRRIEAETGEREQRGEGAEAEGRGAMGSRQGSASERADSAAVEGGQRAMGDGSSERVWVGRSLSSDGRESKKRRQELHERSLDGPTEIREDSVPAASNVSLPKETAKTRQI
jgi:hypothetical protein